MKRRYAAKLFAPASPADTAVVVPWNGTSSSAGMPIAEPYGNVCACRSISPGVTSRPVALSTLSARSAGMSACTASITPLRIPMSRIPRNFWLGSRTSPPLINRSNLSLGPIAARASSGSVPATVAAPRASRNRRRSNGACMGLLPGLFELGAYRDPANGRGQGKAARRRHGSCCVSRRRLRTASMCPDGGKRCKEGCKVALPLQSLQPA